MKEREKILAQLVLEKLKIQHVYKAVRKGQKFKNAGIEAYNSKNPAKQTNLLKELSRNNLRSLITSLKKTGDPTKRFGLETDEIDLFAALLNLPYRLQHATNYYYPILQSRSLKSYTEILHNQPEYTSPFSTPGNIKKLGNGGFVFFRLFTEGVNGESTRYGDTKLIANMALLRKCGWISLHDQLKPFPHTTPASRSFYWGKHLFRTATVVDSKNRNADDALMDSIQYQYRTSKMNGNKKDTQKDFQDAKKTKTITRTFKFTEEIFYGEDILLGITLSVIRELRHLKECGFRDYFLKQVLGKDPQQNTQHLGNLIKGLFRIEGKYPVAMQFDYQPNPERLIFKPSAKTDSLKEVDSIIKVINPDGDGRFKKDNTVNPTKMKIAQLKESIEKNRFNVRFDKTKTIMLEVRKMKFQLALYSMLEKAGQQNLVQKVDRYTELYNEEIIDAASLEKLSIEKLLIIIEDPFYELLRDTDIGFKKMMDCPIEILEIIQDSYGQILEYGFVTFDELIETPIEELEALGEFDLLYALRDGGQSFSELLKLYREDPMHITCLTTEDLTELVLDNSDDLSPVLLKHAKEQEVDLDWVLEQMGESDRELFKLNNGFYDEPPEENDRFEEAFDPEFSDDEQNSPITATLKKPVVLDKKKFSEKMDSKHAQEKLDINKLCFPATAAPLVSAFKNLTMTPPKEKTFPSKTGNKITPNCSKNK